MEELEPNPRVAGWRDACLIGMFSLLLLIPTGAALLHWDPTAPINEKRALRPRPAFSSESWAEFPAAFDNYFNDHFGLRNTLIRWHSMAKVFGLGVSPNATVVIGRKGWLFLAEDAEVFRSGEPLRSGRLREWQLGLERIQQQIERQGARFILVIAPSPASIYPEYLPASHRRDLHQTLLDQFQEQMRSTSTVPVYDLRPALLAAKGGSWLYQHTDTHWNELGAYVAYADFIGHLAGSWPNLPAPWSRERFDERLVRRKGGDLATSLGLNDLLKEEFVEMAPRHPRQASRLGETLMRSGEPGQIRMGIGGKAPRALMIHDSFTYVGWYPLLAEHFSQIQFIRRAENTVLPSPQLFENLSGIDIVIQEMVERTLLTDAEGR